MIEVLEVDTFLKELGDDQTGISKPVQVLASNGKRYILKNQNVYNERVQQWENWDSMFMQEIIVYNLAIYLGIQVPDCAIINVDSDFIDHAPSLRFSRHFSPGKHFASEFVENVENNLFNGYKKLIHLGKPYIRTSWTNFFKHIHNHEDIAKIIALDLLTANFDRFSNVGNLMIAKNNGVRTAYAIDHGHCFWGPAWNLRKRSEMHGVIRQDYLPRLISTYIDPTIRLDPMAGLGNIFRAMDQHIDVSDPNDHSFKEVVWQIENITPQRIAEWFEDVSDDWFVDKMNQINLYKHFIMEQKNKVRILIDEMARLSAFQSYTGGVLQWNESHTGTQ